MKYCDSVVFLLSENYFYPLHQAYNIMLQSPHRFVVAAAPHHRKHQRNAAMFRILTLKFGKK